MVGVYRSTCNCHNLQQLNMSKKITLTELKKHLRKKSDVELVEEIADLYKKFDSVKEYYRASFLTMTK